MSIKSYLGQFRDIWNSLPDERKNTKIMMYVVFLGFLIGLCAGSIIAVFRITTNAVITKVLAWSASGDFTTLTLGIWFGAAIAAALIVGVFIRNSAIRFGGGQWIVDALADGQSRPWLRILFPKFIGSWLVMAFCISVGREGPCIEMGAATALGLKNFDNKDYIERRYFILGGCAAGLSAAFSAPFAGICYVYEIMRQKMNPVLFTFLLGGGFGVYLSVTQVFGLDVMMPLGATPMPELPHLWILLPLALFAGAGGILYNYLLHFSMRIYARQKVVPMFFRPLFPFLGAAAMVLVFPAITGEGLPILTSMEHGNSLVSYLCVFVCAKLLFTAFCYGSGIPAGLMVPVICIGGVLGGIYADWLMMLGLLPPGYSMTCVALGMCACFAAAERAPVTGLVLIAEMTGAFNTSLGLLFVGAIAAMCAKLARVQSG